MGKRFFNLIKSAAGINIRTDDLESRIDSGDVSQRDKWSEKLSDYKQELARYRTICNNSIMPGLQQLREELNEISKKIDDKSYKTEDLLNELLGLLGVVHYETGPETRPNPAVENDEAKEKEQVSDINKSIDEQKKKNMQAILQPAQSTTTETGAMPSLSQAGVAKNNLEENLPNG